MAWLTPLYPAILKWINERKLYVVIAAFAFVGGCYLRGCMVPIVGDKDQQAEHGTGWLDEPEEVKRTVATFVNPFFGDAAKPLIQAQEERDAFLWLAYEKIHKHPWRPHDQNGTGCCVGEGFSAGVEILAACDIAIHGNNNEYKDVSASAIYALAREQGGLLGRGDGAVGAHAAKALMTLGSISCEEAGDDNFTNPAHAQRAKSWGRTGLPADLKKIALTHRIKSASQVRTPEEVLVALQNCYPVPICSSVGFEGKGGFKRDADGFCYPGGTWAHCMCIVGYRKDKRAFLVLQSWGKDSPPGPKVLGQPDGSFWITWEACQKIVRSGECYALSAYDGYPARNIDVFIQKPVKREYVSRNLFQLLGVVPCSSKPFWSSQF